MDFILKFYSRVALIFTVISIKQLLGRNYMMNGNDNHNKPDFNGLIEYNKSEGNNPEEKQTDQKLCQVNDTSHHIHKLLASFQPKCDNIMLKLYPDYHELSVEEQIFFLKITEGIFGYNEQIRNDTLKMLSTDYHIKYLAPYLSQFIKQSIHLNLIFTDLTLLIYSVRMTKSLLANEHVHLKLYFHDILPAILSCALTKRISKYYYDNHWTLRDFSAYVVATICHMHGNKINNIVQRVVNIYMRPIKQQSMPLTTLYGALKGLTSLGEETIKSFIIPNLHSIGKRIFVILENRNYILDDKQQTLEAKHIRDLIVNSVSPILLKTRNINDGGDQYIREFGYFGYLMYLQVKNLERIEFETKNGINVKFVNTYDNSFKL